MVNGGGERSPLRQQFVIAVERLGVHPTRDVVDVLHRRRQLGAPLLLHRHGGIGVLLLRALKHLLGNAGSEDLRISRRGERDRIRISIAGPPCLRQAILARPEGSCRRRALAPRCARPRRKARMERRRKLVRRSPSRVGLLNTAPKPVAIATFVQSGDWPAMLSWPISMPPLNAPPNSRAVTGFAIRRWMFVAFSGSARAAMDRLGCMVRA